MKCKILIISLLLFGWSCSSDKEKVTSTQDKVDSENALFERMESSYTGVDFINALSDDPLGDRNVLSFPHYYNGAGVAVGDINNDGLPDLFFVANEVPNRLYLNKGNLQFEDITESSGIQSANKQWSTGAVMVDINGDGYLDIYVCQAGYEIIPNRKDRENLLFVNNGDNTFTERAAEYGINDANESISAVFFDYNKDGLLDLYVLNESEYAFKVYKQVFDALKDKKNLENASGNLYKNLGNGKFKKVTEEAGLLRYGFGLGVVAADLNKDGWVDLYVSNDYSVPDFMFINNGDGTFTDRVKEMTRNISFFGMGLDIADINNDGLPDIAVVDMAANDHIKDKTLMESMDVEGFWYFVNTLGYQHQYMFNSLQLNNGNNTFSNTAALSGLLRSDWSWAALLMDADNDGYKDYFISNGYRRYARDNDFRNKMAKIREANNNSVPLNRREEMYYSMPEIPDQNRMYKNNGNLTFTLVSDDWGFPEMTFSNGAVYADLDGDGDLEIIINNIDQEAMIYKNLSREKQGGNYLQLVLKGETPGEVVYNTKVYAKYDGQVQYLEFQPTRGYAGSVEPLMHFGVGDRETIDELIIQWPGERETILTEVKVNQKLELTPKGAKPFNRQARKENKPLPFKEVNPFSRGLDFVHKENPFNDFAVEILLPHKQSTLGPRIAVGDVNGDGLEDVFIGGAAGQAGALYLQDQRGMFAKQDNAVFAADAASEDMGVVFFDADNNGTLDLYVVSGGGGEFTPGSQLLQDRMYINTDGKGTFSKVNALPENFSAGSVVKSADIDGDGIPEIFVGGAAVPGRYPFAEKSRILKLSGNKYVDISPQIMPELSEAGLVKDAIWVDLNQNGALDLVVVGEWMPIMVFINEGGNYREAGEEWGVSDLMGWWYSIASADLDGDGLLDLVVGNVGLNTKFTATKEKPFYVFADDFDNNGTVDIVLSKYYDGKLVPSRGRQCSSEQMPFITSKFPTYQAFATAGLQDIYGDEKLEAALQRKVNTFASSVLMNKKGSFEVQALPNLAQISPIKRILIRDFNQDGFPDLLLAGNMYNTEVETPRYDAGNGLILLGDGKGGFSPRNVGETGFFAPGNVKDMAIVQAAEKDKFWVLVANNDSELQIFEVKGSID
jgi:enediyne biosynthesis protein E4